ncbi:sensor histidine kinase [Myceligenerans pegani]|uniref:histidine kinase n=1 Tax=Myceligenerans pegani TaxID=2776917 RepID=A0ABR9MSJ5_9MICO|nr:histidine kinase [Myceligenerans sp. TRM 65318]MBE1874347.1 two-component sensor histidine kinase [Myceligenerans sp. TRM 65318]MBE3016618.1 two-component sensor histidine kinase [Myceligenerans sp. TRM 65318]
MIRIFVRRFAWTMVGAAIGLAAVLVVYFGLRAVLDATIAGPDGAAVPDLLVAGVSVAAALALGLVPGARELEVTAARSLLRADAELVVPDRETWAHRARSGGWIAFHLLAGLVVGFCLFALVPAAVVVGTEAALGRSVGSTVPVVEGAGPRTAVVAGCVIGGGVVLTAAWPVGALAERLVGRFLGPTAADRLEVALARQQREAEHTLLARELHDGIGHALTIVSVQAAAGRRVANARPERAAAALAAIEEVSRGALVELDALLGMLRDDRPPTPAGGLADVVEQHRRSGLDVVDAVDLPSRLPPLLHRTVVRIVAEGLTNAHRHGAPGPVRVTVAHTDEEVIVQVSNAVTAGAGMSDSRGGRGLAGIRERASLFGGSAEFGVAGQEAGAPAVTGDDAGRWVLDVRLPRITAPPPAGARATGSRDGRSAAADEARGPDGWSRPSDGEGADD